MKRLPSRLPKSFWACAGFLVIGLICGVILTAATYHTNWISVGGDFFFWASIITTIFSVVLGGYSLSQYLSVEYERRKGDAQVKIWMENANGIHQGLRTISINCIDTQDPDFPKYSTVRDVGMAIYALAESAKTLYQSLYEERCVTEDQYAAQQKEIGEAMHRQRLKKIGEEEVTMPLT